MDSYEKEKYERALKKTKDIKGFYTHALVYFVINLLLFLAHIGVFKFQFSEIEWPHWSFLSTPFFWGIGLFFHGLHVFRHKFGFFRDWEERKIKQFMEEDDEDFKNTTKWD